MSKPARVQMWRCADDTIYDTYEEAQDNHRLALTKEQRALPWLQWRSTYPPNGVPVFVATPTYIKVATYDAVNNVWYIDDTDTVYQHNEFPLWAFQPESPLKEEED